MNFEANKKISRARQQNFYGLNLSLKVMAVNIFYFFNFGEDLNAFAEFKSDCQH